jgi:hypothetical protein
MSAIFDEIIKLPSGMVLPKVVADLTPEQLADISNGCGPASVKMKLIPDSILGVNFRDACNVHDACYHFGEDESDKQFADELFLLNLVALINKHCPGSGLLDHGQRVACRSAAFDYYVAVAEFGDSAFWADKDRPKC